jgi:hypothetical protein
MIKRTLALAPQSYDIGRLKAEIQAAMPVVMDVNEVDRGAEGVKIAVYCDDDVTLNEAVLIGVIAAHDPTPPTPEPTLEQRTADNEEALSALFDLIAVLRPGGDN